MNEEVKLIQIDKLSRRNAVSAQEALRALDGRISELYAIIQNQQQGITALTRRLTELEDRYMLQKVQLTSAGPSVK